MTEQSVEEILRMIDQLSNTDRDLLEQRLAERVEAEWRIESERARQEAEARGIDQAAIDAAIHKRRYGA